MKLQASTFVGPESSLRDRLRLVLLGRVLVVSVFLATVGAWWFVAPQIARGLIGETTFVIIGLAYAGTILSALLVHSIRRPKVIAYLQIFFDGLLITGALGALGDGGGPLAVLYILPIANAAGLLMLPGALLAALVSTVGYGALLLHDQHAAVMLGGAIEVATNWLIAVVGVSLGLVAFGMGSLARRLAAAEGAVEKQRAEVARLEELHRAIADGVECGILCTDGKGRVRSANTASQQILSLPAASILDREISWLLPLLEAAVEEDPSADYVEFDQRVGEAESRRLRVGRNSLRDTYGNAIGELLVLQDVSRIEELEGRLAEEEGASLILGDPPGGDSSPSMDRGPASEDGLIGDCPQMGAISRVIDKVAATDATVLVTGESGTGKELVARAIHRRSPRAQGPFVVVNCGAIPETLIESELFGHVRGSFTGAVTDRPGLFRRAHKGTIFLDEIGELSPALQVRLLRVLQDHQVLPVGATESQRVDVRVVAATNRILEELVKSGDYRQDLYYRLAVVSIDLPPLRERGRDIGLLVEHCLRRGAERHGKPVRGVSAKAMALLLRHPYAGNVRELENVIEHAITLADRDTLQESDLPDAVRGVVPRRRFRPEAAESTVLALDGSLPARPEPLVADESSWSLRRDGEARVVEHMPRRVRLPIDDASAGSLDEQLARQEKEMLVAALERAAGVKKKAAVLLGINYRSFRHRLQKYGLDSHGEASLGTVGRGANPIEAPDSDDLAMVRSDQGS